MQVPAAKDALRRMRSGRHLRAALWLLATRAVRGAETDRRARELSLALGLERRSDRKFAEFVEQHHEGDGEGRARVWASVDGRWDTPPRAAAARTARARRPHPSARTGALRT